MTSSMLHATCGGPKAWDGDVLQAKGGSVEVAVFSEAAACDEVAGGGEPLVGNGVSPGSGSACGGVDAFWG